MKLKPGVSIKGISPQAVLGAAIAESVYYMAGEDLTITAVTDGKHMEGSLHYQGRALDLRLPEEPAQMVVALRAALGDEWDVVLEKTHLHIEFDPHA